jgi:hypothetical protein
MVVCWVVRIVNETNRTFVVQPNDPFYSPQIKDQAGRGVMVEIPPGFDEQCANVAVPWATAARGGLYINEVEAQTGDGIRCVTGPNTTMTEDAKAMAEALFQDLEPGRLDWLRLHTADWKVINPERWMPLGSRHYFGAVGKQVEMQLSFRGAPDASLADLIQFRPAVDCLPRNAVLLNVYDLVGELTTANSFLNNSLVKSIGAFHAGVEVYGWEFAFYRTSVKDACGVFRSLKPREHPAHVYRQSINLGETKLKDWEIRWLIQRLANEWNGHQFIASSLSSSLSCVISPAVFPGN